jgi:VWFA-related protein
MAFLISFGAEAELLQDSTNSAALLRKGLDGLRVSTSFSGVHPGPVPTSRQKGTILFDAVYLATTEKLRGEVGRKVVVIISDGVDVGSQYDIKQAIEAAHKADAIIYSIYYADPQYQYWGGGGDGDLKKMSEDTGGRFYKVGRDRDLDRIFDEIQQEVRSQYTLSYTPANPEKDGAFRKLEIKPARKDLKVQARKGYYATAAGD